MERATKRARRNRRALVTSGISPCLLALEGDRDLAGYIAAHNVRDRTGLLSDRGNLAELLLGHSRNLAGNLDVGRLHFQPAAIFWSHRDVTVNCDALGRCTALGERGAEVHRQAAAVGSGEVLLRAGEPFGGVDTVVEGYLLLAKRASFAGYLAATALNVTGPYCCA